jgi:hypothetical protein
MKSDKPGVLIAGVLYAALRVGIVASIVLAAGWKEGSGEGVIGGVVGSLVLGVVIGMIAGRCPGPWSGAVLGGFLSLILSIITIPIFFISISTVVLCGIFESRRTEGPIEYAGLAITLVTLAGALAGGIGGWCNQDRSLQLRAQRIATYRERFASLSTEYLTTTIELGASDAEATEVMRQILRERREAGESS